MRKKIVILGALDTKGAEIKFLKGLIEDRGLETIVIDFGLMAQPFFTPNIGREQVAAASDVVISELISANNRGLAMKTMANGIVRIVKDLYANGRLDGIISLGGSMGTTVSTTAMRSLPIGVPKIMVSTVASGDVRSYIGTRDITMMHPIVDILGLNAISKRIFDNAAGAMGGMVQQPLVIEKGERGVVSITMVGITTPCVMKAKLLLEFEGFETFIFHSTGVGGQAMEEMIEEGLITRGVLDVSINEVAGEIVGTMSAGPTRLEAAGKKGIPQVICPGAADGVVFKGKTMIPQKYRKRKFFDVAPQIIVMRTNKEENAKLGRIVAEKANKAVGPTKILIPLKGFSAFDVEGQWGYDPEADNAFIKALKKNIDAKKIEVIDMDVNINSEIFAEKIVDIFIRVEKGDGRPN